MTEEVIIDLNLKQNESDFAKLANLRNSISNLKDQQKQLNEDFKQGKVPIQRYNAESVKLETTLKKTQAAYSGVQRGITGLKNPFDKLNESISANTAVIDKLIPGMGTATSGFISMARAAMAFIATPIGMVLAAVAAAIGAITAAIKTNDAVADDFEAVWGSITAVFHEAFRTVGMLGGALVKFAKGDFAGAFDDVGDAVGGFGERMEESAKQGYELARALQELEDKTNKFRATEQATRNEIDKLILQSKDRAKTEAERIKLNEQAAALEKKLTEENLELIKEAADLELKRLGEEQKIARRRNESSRDFGLRLLESGRFGEEAQNKIVAAVRAVDEALNSSIKLQEKLQNQRNALLDKQDEDDRKRKEKKDKEREDYIKESVKAAEEERERFLKDEEEFQALKDANSTAAFKAWWDERVRIASEANEEMDRKAQAEFEKDKIRQIKKVEGVKVLTNDITTILTQGLQGNVKTGEQILKGYLIMAARALKTFLITKAVGESLTTWDSILTFGISGAIRGAVIAGLIEAAFAGIESAISGFADGGVVSGTKIKDGKRIQRSNGDDVLITAKRGEVILNERQQRALGGDKTFAKLGVPGFAMGGMVTSPSTSFGADSDLIKRMLRDISRRQVAVVIEDVERLQQTRAQIVEQATL